MGAEYIRTACDSKLITTDLGSFTAGADITVYIAVDTRVTENLPAWLGSWTKTDSSVSTSNDLTLQLYKKNFNSGDSVTLGTNGGSGNSVNYVVAAVPKEVEPISGTLIKDLTVYDKENAADWSIYNDFKSGSQLYGDRDITAVSVPKNLVNAETIRTACAPNCLQFRKADSQPAQMLQYTQQLTAVLQELSLNGSRHGLMQELQL